MEGNPNLPCIENFSISDILVENLGENQSFNLKNGTINILYGEIRAGKTTLIHSILAGIFGQHWLNRKNKNLSFLLSRSSHRPPSIQLKIGIKDTYCILERELINGTLINLEFENFEVVQDKTKEDMYSHWLEVTSNTSIEKLLDIYDILFYFEE